MKKSVNRFHILNEILIAIFYLILLSKRTYFAHFRWEDISSKCISIVLAAWGMNLALSIYLSAVKIYLYIIQAIRKKRLSKVVNIESNNNATGASPKKKKYIDFFNQ